MARETKQDRLVRGIFDQVGESLHQLKELISNPGTKEMDVERWAEGVLRSCLGFTATNGYSIKAQESKGKMRPDLVVYSGEKPVLVVEIKKLGFDLAKSDFRSGKLQLNEYLHAIGNVRWGILCNGYEWKLFDYNGGINGGVEIYSFDLRDDADQIDLSKRAIDDSCWEFVEFHESSLRGKLWEEYALEATAFSPESLSRAILSLKTIRYIAKEIRGEHDYKANIEVLLERVSSLLAKGLDDSISGWNEQREAELKKYVTSQKRAGRRTRKKKSDLTQNSDPVSAVDSPDVAPTVDPIKKAS